VKRSGSQDKAAPIERRSGKDRRQVDAGPPGRHERRRSVESRQPEIVELKLSDSQWGALIDDAPAPPAPDEPGKPGRGT
jgi:hypothetical protein